MTPDAMLRLILTTRVYDVARTTPLDRAHRLSLRNLVPTLLGPIDFLVPGRADRNKSRLSSTRRYGWSDA